MAIGDRGITLRQLDTLFSVGVIGGLSDAQLIERFTCQQDGTAEIAFRALLERHGPMVLRVCRSVLRDSDSAADAFQATFLVLVRRAGSLWVRDSLGPWLHQVAFRTASCVKTAEARRRRHERRAAEMTHRPAQDRDCDDCGAVVHEELGRLPERYRQAVVLCLLEGLTPEQAARHLNCPVGTVHSRLARGRERLRARLTRRGLAISAGLSALGSAHDAVSAAVPPALADSTVRGALPFATGNVSIGSVPASVTTLTTMIMGAWGYGRMSFSPDGLWLAGGMRDGSVEIWDPLRGERVWNVGRHQNDVNTVGFGRDSRTLVSGGGGGLCYLWDLRPPGNRPDHDPARLWDDLAGEDGLAAYQAMWALLEMPDRAVAMAAEKLRPLTRVVDLDHVDEGKARDELERLRRMKKLLVTKDPQVESAIAVRRAISLLAQIGTPDAIGLLKSLTEQGPKRDLGPIAAAALNRLTIPGKP